MPTEYLTTREAAEFLDVSQSRVVQFCREGRLGRKIGRNWAITRAQLEAFRKIERKPGPRCSRAAKSHHARCDQ